MRRFRVYHKKRGNRRTGSPKLGTIGEVVFFAVCLVLGCAGLAVMLATLAVPQWKANHEFVAHRCRVLDVRLGRKEADPPPTQNSTAVTLYRPEVQIEYQVDGQTYRNWTYDVRGEYSPNKAKAKQVLDRFRPEREYDCWYDPSDPNVAVLARGSSWWAWLILIVPFSFVLIGGWGLVYQLFAWGKSAERRADWVKRAGRLASSESNGLAKAEFPHIPGEINITNSPGTNLAYRLPTATSTTWRLVVTFCVCMVWNGIVAAFVVAAARSHLAGQPDWFRWLFIAPFAAVGIGFIVLLIRQVFMVTAIGPTLLEISDQPLCPGNRYRLFLSQTGRLKLNAIELLLVCDEETTFQHGTNTRTETQRVYEQRVFYRDVSGEHRATPLETKCELDVPAGVMHSFKSAHNEINWKVLVRGEVAGWPDFQRSFPLIVHPSQNGNHKS